MYRSNCASIHAIRAVPTIGITPAVRTVLPRITSRAPLRSAVAVTHDLPWLPKARYATRSTQNKQRRHTSQIRPSAYVGTMLRDLNRTAAPLRAVARSRTIYNHVPVNRNRIPSRKYSTDVSISASKQHNQLQPGKQAEQLGLQQFLSKVYVRTGAGIFGTVALATTLAPLGMTFFPHLFGGGFVLSMASVLGISFIKPEIKTKTINGQEIVFAKDKPLRELAYGGLVAGMGISLAPLMQIIYEVSPMIVPMSLGLTGALFGGCWWYSKRCTDLQMMKWRAPLMIGLGTLIGGGLISLGSMFFLGPNMFSNMWMNVDIYGGIALFTGMTIYDMYMAEKMYREKMPDHIGCATNIYLDFINIMIRIMQAMAKAKK